MRATSRVVGMVAGGRQHIVSQVSHGDPVLLKPEPTNPHDPHAVAVYTAPRRVLLHPDELTSSVSDPPAGQIHDADRVLLIDRQAGYLPREVAARLRLPADGVVGWISDVRYKPPDDRIDRHGRSTTDGDPTPAGFDVTAWLPIEHADAGDDDGSWGEA